MGTSITERTIPAGAFRDRCLRLMDEINETGESIVVTKHGRPVVIISPAPREATGLVGFMTGVTRILDDLDEPATPAEEWDIVSNPDRIVDPSRL